MSKPDDDQAGAVKVKRRKLRTVPNEVEPAKPGIHLDWAAFWSRDRPPTYWLLEPLIPVRRATHIYAKRAEGKSSLSINLAAALATGKAFLDRPAGDPIKVGYLDREMGQDDLMDHLEEYGYGPSDDLSNLFYSDYPNIGMFDEETGAQELLDWVEACGIELLIVDSITASMASEENSNDGYQKLLTMTVGPLKKMGVTSLWLGNQGHSDVKHSRGGSRKEDIMDCVWDMKKGDEGRLTLNNTKSRSAMVPSKIEMYREETGKGELVYRQANPQAQLPSGSVETAMDLDRLQVDLKATVNEAVDALKAAGRPKRRTTVSGALRYRRHQASERSLELGNRSGNRPSRKTPEPEPEPLPLHGL